MGKFFLLSLMALLSVVLGPTNLMASDTVSLKTPNEAAEFLTETTINAASEITDVSEQPVTFVQTDTLKINTVMVASDPNSLASTSVMNASEPQNMTENMADALVLSVVPVDQLQINGKSLPIVAVNSTTVDAEGHINHYRNLFYGHNRAEVLGGIVGMRSGELRIVLSGIVTTYRIAEAVTFEKNPTTGELQLDGEGSFMNAVAGASFRGQKYDIAVMTCAGVNYGNGDASHRYVIFANKI